MTARPTSHVEYTAAALVAVWEEGKSAALSPPLLKAPEEIDSLCSRRAFGTMRNAICVREHVCVSVIRCYTDVTAEQDADAHKRRSIPRHRGRLSKFGFIGRSVQCVSVCVRMCVCKIKSLSLDSRRRAERVWLCPSPRQAS